jgi:hypothetical protein
MSFTSSQLRCVLNRPNKLAKSRSAVYFGRVFLSRLATWYQNITKISEEPWIMNLLEAFQDAKVPEHATFIYFISRWPSSQRRYLQDSGARMNTM